MERNPSCSKVVSLSANYEPMNTVFRLTFLGCRPDPELFTFFSTTIQEDIVRFWIPPLPERYCIEVSIQSEDDFVRNCSTTLDTFADSQNPIAYIDSSIHVLHYSYISAFCERKSYLKIIRHECVHALQLLTSLVHPKNCQWLYESIACAVAEQEQPISETIPAWETFVEHFYEIPGCYAIAYHFGSALLHRFSIPEIIRLSKSNAECVAECQRLYKEVFNK